MMKLKNYFEKINTSRAYFTVLIISIIWFLKIVVVVPQVQPIWNLYWDTNDYRLQSQSSLLSADFYAPQPRRWFSPRPFTMSLMYKLVDSDMFEMVLFQKYFYCLSVIALIVVINNYLKNYLVRSINSVFLLFFFTWWNMVGWSGNVSSESISISFLFLWIANILWYYQSYSRFSIICLIFTTILFSFTRDNWPYIVLIFFIVNFAITFFYDKSKTKVNILFISFAICLFAAQNYTSKRGERSVMPVFNSIIVRISQTDKYLEWFKEQGMPDVEEVKADFKNIDVSTNQGVEKVYAVYEDSLYPKLLKWVKDKGVSTYQKFIITHPGYFFFEDQTSAQLERIFMYDIGGYYPKSPGGFFENADNFFPVFNNYVFILLMLICIFIFYKTKSIIDLMPAILGCLFILNTMILYNADAMEVKRHMFMTVTCREFPCILALFIIINYFIELKRINDIKYLELSNKIKQSL